MWKKKRGGRNDKRGTDSGIILFSASFSTTSSLSFSSTTHCRTVLHAVRQSGGGAEEGEGSAGCESEGLKRSTNGLKSAICASLSLGSSPFPPTSPPPPPTKYPVCRQKGWGSARGGLWAGCGWGLESNVALLHGNLRCGHAHPDRINCQQWRHAICGASQVPPMARLKIEWRYAVGGVEARRDAGGNTCSTDNRVIVSRRNILTGEAGAIVSVGSNNGEERGRD